MAYCFQKSLQELVLLPHRALHSRTRHWRGQLGSAEFKLGLCLLAWQQNGGLGKMGYRSLNEYAEKALQLSGKKLYALLSTVRALQYLPKLCEAYQNGTLCWSCLRSIQTLATPETQDVWLAFAREYRSDQIARMVAMSPRKWKWYRALEASLQQRPLITAEELATMLRELAPLARAGGRRKKSAPDSALSSAPAEAAEAAKRVVVRQRKRFWYDGSDPGRRRGTAGKRAAIGDRRTFARDSVQHATRCAPGP